MARKRLPEKLYRIGEVIEHSGLSRQTLQFYATIGLIREKRRTPSGYKVRSAARRTQRILREGDAVRLDPVLGTIELLGSARQAVLLRLEEALRAYDRGADIQAMAIWTIGQLTASGLGPAQKRDLADTLIYEMRRRVRTGAPKTHLERIQALVKKHLG